MKLNSRYCLTAISALLISCVSVETYAEKNTFATDSLNIKKETIDTVVGKTLKEIVVEGQSQYVTSEGMVFMPDEKTRKMASNGFSLLDIMAIPGLNVNRVEGTVKTAADNDVSFFIDYQPASTAQMRGLLPEDVRRVEVLDYPADPRFKGEKHVVNFILVKYEHGGYVNGGGMQGLRTSWGLYNLYSKTAYKSMTYDVLLGATYINPMHSDHIDTESIYHFPGMEVKHEQVSRNIKSVSPGYWVSARVIYEKERMSIANTIGYSGNRTKNGETEYTDIFSSPLYPSGKSIQREDRRSNSVEWSGDYSFELPWNLWLVASPSATYTRSHNDSFFTSDGFEIANKVPETAWNAGLNAIIQRSFGKHSLTLQLKGGLSNNYMDYLGTNPIHIIARQGDFMGKIKGAFRFSKLNLDATVGLYTSRYSTNSDVELQTTMDADVSANYRFDQKNSLRLTYQLSYTNPTKAARNPNLVFSNMIDALQGNPDLRRYSKNRASLEYTLLLTNDLWISLTGQFIHYADPIVATYTPILVEDKYMMVRSSENMGHYSIAHYGGSITYKLFNKSLTLTGSIYGREDWRNYYGSAHTSYPEISARVQYILKDFYFSANWRSRSMGLGWTDYSKGKHRYSLSIGYSKAGFDITATANDFFEKSKKYSTSYMSTPYFDQQTTRYGIPGVCSFSVSVSYSFSYGKKVNQWDRVGQAGTVESGANL